VAPLPSEAPALLTTQQAAKVLNVSRPYVLDLVNAGAFNGVTLTKGNHRRIPADEVERVRKSMHMGMRKAIDDIAQMTEAASERELKSAKKSSTRRWASKA
jgi:excisionase family DNA binding protein